MKKICVGYKTHLKHKGREKNKDINMGKKPIRPQMGGDLIELHLHQTLANFMITDKYCYTNTTILIATMYLIT